MEESEHLAKLATVWRLLSYSDNQPPAIQGRHYKEIYFLLFSNHTMYAAHEKKKKFNRKN